MEQESEIPC